MGFFVLLIDLEWGGGERGAALSCSQRIICTVFAFKKIIVNKCSGVPLCESYNSINENFEPVPPTNVHLQMYDYIYITYMNYFYKFI